MAIWEEDIFWEDIFWLYLSTEMGSTNLWTPLFFVDPAPIQTRPRAPPLNGLPEGHPLDYSPPLNRAGGGQGGHSAHSRPLTRQRPSAISAPRYH